MKIIQYPLPDVSTYEITKLTSSINSNSLTHYPEDIDKWTEDLTYFSGTGLSVNTSDFKFGTASIQLELDNNYYDLTINFNETKDLSNYHTLVMWTKVIAKSFSVNYIRIYSDNGDYFELPLNDINPYETEWTQLGFDLREFTAVGNPDWTKCVSIVINQKGNIPYGRVLYDGVYFNGITINVENTADFKNSDYIIIEKVGNEIAEMAQIINVVSQTELQISLPIRFDHQEGTCIRKTPFNYAKLYRSTDNTTYDLIDYKELDWQDKYGLITFVDNDGSDDYYYKVEYYNSTTDSGIMSSPIKTQTATGFLTVEEFKRETGMSGDDETIAAALKYGAENIKRNLYTKREAQFGTPDTKFQIDSEDYGDTWGLQFADANLNGEIDKYDFIAWEQEQDGTRTYVTSDIVDIDVDRHIIYFGSTHPAANNKLVIQYYLTFRKTTEMEMKMRRLNMLYAVNYLFRSIAFRKLQDGISSWTINGVSVSFDGSAVRDTIEQNEKEIAALLKELAALYVRFTTIHRPVGSNMRWFKSTLTFGSDNVPVP